MKRNRIVAIFVLLLCLCPLISAYAVDDGFVVDGANLLSTREEAALRAKLQSISEQYQAQIVIVTTDSVPFGNIDSYLDDYYDSHGLGYGKNHDGVLLLLCMDLREYRILSNGYAAEAIDSNRIDQICDVIVSDLSDGEYADAFTEFADQCAYYLDGHLNGFPFDAGTNLMIALLIGITVGLIVAFVLKGQLKSVRQQNQANLYVKPGSMHLTAHSDLFLYRNVTRTRRESSSSSRSGSSRGGSSRSRGGGSF